MGSHHIARQVLAGGQGMARRSSLLRRGVGSLWLRRRLADGTFCEPWPGVVAGVPPTTLHEWVRAGLLYVGANGWVSHQTALVMYGLMSAPMGVPTIHVSVPHGARKRSQPGLVIHQRRSAPQVEFGSGLPLAPVSDALADVAGILPLNDVRSMAAEAVRTKRAAIEDLGMVGRRASANRRVLAGVVEELTAGAASGPEMAVWRGIKDAGLPLPQLNSQWNTDDGPKYLDGLWRLLRLGYEIDGRSVHAQAEAFDADRWRHNHVQASGINLLHISGAQAFSQLDAVLTVMESTMRVRAKELGLKWRQVMSYEASG
jgi:very-short-patch-repair endonuclease